MRKFAKLLTAATACFAGFGLASPAHAQAEDYPSKRVTIIVPYSAGGATDVLARQVAQGLSEQWDETVTVENRPGAGATLGTAQAARAQPDGHTLFMGQVSSHGIAPAVYANLQYKPKEDFEPVVWITEIPNVMVVPKDSEATTVQEFVEGAKGNNVSFGSSGTGSSIHLSGEMFKARTGLDMTHVPYRGSGEAVPALVSGNIDVMFDNLPSAMPQIKAGTIRALAVTSAERDSSLPEVPTLAESGVAGLEGFEAKSWFGLLAPAGTDAAIIEKVNASVNEVIEGETFQTYARNNGATVVGGSPEDFATFIDAELAKWAKVVADAGVRVD
ncbi:Bug family tripartite tricarboxylate transporter substrate binding protein [Aurantimonas coralicida]|uniref:Bug family tripartite tricarboxylate transporter substrate binding protein n=1 Tax=Aurantimonas coralicida TaxID=182270 RepID=UPI001E4C2D53|nr:tripartite tricarboxylate transporter substrate binding protein [Aurantimonas coralicida]MCD1645551.1 tripartite tricarboxylate transporter substrate binding protein [Aurantimonas coralicida]